MTAPTKTELPHPPIEAVQVTDVLHALSDPVRLQFVRELDACGTERACGTFSVPVAKSTATHHWRVLRECGVVGAREEGTRKYHRLRREELDHRFPGLLDAILGGAA